MAKRSKVEFSSLDEIVRHYDLRFAFVGPDEERKKTIDDIAASALEKAFGKISQSSIEASEGQASK